jgi:hypothetical protein
MSVLILVGEVMEFPAIPMNLDIGSIKALLSVC